MQEEVGQRPTDAPTLKAVAKWLGEGYHYKSTLIGTPENPPPRIHNRWYVKVDDKEIEMLWEGKLPGGE